MANGSFVDCSVNRSLYQGQHGDCDVLSKDTVEFEHDSQTAQLSSLMSDNTAYHFVFLQVQSGACFVFVAVIRIESCASGTA